ncbi:hypothetical protein IQ238_06785 [Pleurocapsales cyanobacterium LEGE 06147]|nr:hypothetical protein [Pleurocapsales cyanobacterium LEGE 06147]
MVSHASNKKILTVNPGDRIAPEPQTIEEKAKQIAVDNWDLTGHDKIPTYFVINYPNGEVKALHHVRDARAISDAIRQMNLQEEEGTDRRANPPITSSGLIIVVGISCLILCLMTAIIAIGVF